MRKKNKKKKNKGKVRRNKENGKRKKGTYCMFVFFSLSFSRKHIDNLILHDTNVAYKTIQVVDKPWIWGRFRPKSRILGWIRKD